MEIRYRGRVVTEADIAFIRELIQANPTASRRRLSTILCEAWDWRQANGALRDMVCRGLMLELHRAGYIELPSRRFSPPNPLANRVEPASLPCYEIHQTPIEGTLTSMRPLEFRQVRRTGEEPLFAALMQEWHYLEYTQPVGEHLKYIIYSRDRPVACMAWSSAPRHIECRDRFIGWSAEIRRKNLHLLAYNSRFLILPWVRVRHLASHILGRMAHVLPRDWQELYKHPIYFLETFVDPDRFKGTCYRAANWIYLGMTKGLGKANRTRIPDRSLKQVLGYPLARDFRKLMCEVRVG
jgi:hypothetical protein